MAINLEDSSIPPVDKQGHRKSKVGSGTRESPFEIDVAPPTESSPKIVIDLTVSDDELAGSSESKDGIGSPPHNEDQTSAHGLSERNKPTNLIMLPRAEQQDDGCMSKCGELHFCCRRRDEMRNLFDNMHRRIAEWKSHSSCHQANHELHGRAQNKRAEW